jgi:hypothetical protein
MIGLIDFLKQQGKQIFKCVPAAWAQVRDNNTQALYLHYQAQIAQIV